MRLFVVLFVALFISSCAENDQSNDVFRYHITGIVENRDGVKVSLIPESNSLDERQTAIIEQGKFEFRGESRVIEPVEIRLEDDIINLESSYSVSSLILEPGETIVEFELTRLNDSYKFSIPKFEKGNLNKELLDFFYKFEDAVKGGSWVFGDSLKMDSMIRKVYPIARERSLEVIKDQFTNGSPELNGFIFNEIIIKRLSRNGLFDKKNLALLDIKKINELHSLLDQSIISPSHNQLFSDVIIQLNSNDNSIVFIDFDLQDSNDKILKLSNIVGDNRYTLVYFWFSGCRPCRDFNKQMNEHYSYLRSKGVEIVAVNVDENKSKWIQSSSQDDLQWINLYAGDKSGLEERYSVRGFPFKMMFDSNRASEKIDLKTTESIIFWSRKLD